MIRNITLANYSYDVNREIDRAAAFLTSIEVPPVREEGLERFTKALFWALNKVQNSGPNEVLTEQESWALRIVVNFALAQARELHDALGRLREEIRAASRASRKEARIARVSAG